MACLNHFLFIILNGLLVNFIGIYSTPGGKKDPIM